MASITSPDGSPPGADPPESELVVRVQSVEVSFGGLVALRDINLGVPQGERLAIIGPNGAGKTTLFNVIAGDITPSRGVVMIKGVNCTELPSRRRPRLGVARTYQKARVLGGLTAQENIYLALAGRRRRHRRLWRSSVDAAMDETAAHVAESVWLSDELSAPAAMLAHGQKRQLELGMALATEPDVLLLDEPASGLSRGERERLVDLLESLSSNVTLLLIEHDMDIAFRLAQRVVVMADGAPIAAGTPQEVQANSRVHEVYLGTGAA